jgi:hypothetical protein
MSKQQIRRLEAVVHHLAAVVGGAPALRPRRLQTAQDVIDLLHEQVEALRAATWLGPVEKARAVGYLASLARQAIETHDLAVRLEKLEAALNPSNGDAKR